MILRAHRLDGECFVEIDAAVRAMTQRNVVFNANTLAPPAGSIVYNLDLVGVHCDPVRWRGHEIWDFSRRNIMRYPAGLPVKHVPVGYHATMRRFERRCPAERDIDVIFCGAPNERRTRALHALRAHNLKVVHNQWAFGAERDALLARSRLALNMRFYEDGVFPVLRTAHLVANGVPVINELSDEMCPWYPGPVVSYDGLVETVIAHVNAAPSFLDAIAARARCEFQGFPLILPT